MIRPSSRRHWSTKIAWSRATAGSVRMETHWRIRVDSKGSRDLDPHPLAGLGVEIVDRGIKPIAAAEARNCRRFM
jgi:hypothetical protein